jgi:CDP-glucose 4,6-dehydratase
MGLKQLFGGVYAGRRVLVTGHSGFKGSWLTCWLRAMDARVVGLALDPDTKPSHWQLLGLDAVADHRADLRDASSISRIVRESGAEFVFHLAAQPLVRRSYREPLATFESNVLGLVHLLEAVRACPSVRVVVNVTTDKVYEEHASEGGYRESDPLGGHDPYSTSKACAELVSSCYRKSYFDTRQGEHGDGITVLLATARAGNVIGGGDWAEDRLVPDLVRAATSSRSLRLRNPDATRPWQHVLDPLAGYLRLGQVLLENPACAEAWNFGPDPEGEVSVHELTSRLHAHWPAMRVEIDREAHPHEAAILRLDCSKAKHRLGWRPVWDLDSAVDRTAGWYRAFHEGGQLQTGKDLEDFVADARRMGLPWAN